MSPGFVKIIIKINLLPFFPCNIREFSSRNSYLEFHFCCCSYFLCLLCFFLSFRTTNSLRQFTMTSCFLKLPFISWDQRYGCTFLSWALSFKNCMKWKEIEQWQLKNEGQWYPIDPYRKISVFQYLLNILLIYYCGSMENNNKKEEYGEVVLFLFLLNLILHCWD